MRILLDNKLKYQIVKTADNSFFILFFACEIALFALAVYVLAFFIGHRWSNRFYRGELMDKYLKQKSKVDSNHKADKKKAQHEDPSRYSEFNIPYYHLIFEPLIDLLYHLFCFMSTCRSCPFRQK